MWHRAMATAIGLGLAEVLVGLRDCLSGTVKLIFQPAEEGVRGGEGHGLPPGSLRAWTLCWGSICTAAGPQVG